MRQNDIERSWRKAQRARHGGAAVALSGCSFFVVLIPLVSDFEANSPTPMLDFALIQLGFASVASIVVASTGINVFDTVLGLIAPWSIIPFALWYTEETWPWAGDIRWSAAAALVFGVFPLTTALLCRYRIRTRRQSCRCCRVALARDFDEYLCPYCACVDPRGPYRPSSLCEGCHYDLTGLVSGVCPECGAAFNAQ